MKSVHTSRIMRIGSLMLAAIAALLPCSASVLRGAEPQYAKVGDIHIGGAGGFDYLTIDSAAKRLFVTYATEVVVIDPSTNAIVGRIADTPRVHGIAIAPG